MPSKLFLPELLEGQVAIVCGGGSGLGGATALEPAGLGAQVVICGRRLEPLEETVVRAEGGRCESRVFDIREAGRNAGGHFPDPGRGDHPEGLPDRATAQRRGHVVMTHAVATRR